MFAAPRHVAASAFHAKKSMDMIAAAAARITTSLRITSSIVLSSTMQVYLKAPLTQADFVATLRGRSLDAANHGIFP